MNNLIIIEDNEMLGNVLKNILRENNFEVQCFQTAEDFLNQKVIHYPCVYIVDIGLPGGVQGMDVIRAIRFRDQISPVFIISGRTDMNEINEALNSGADDYLIKPFAVETLLTKAINAQKKTAHILSKLNDMEIKRIPGTHSLMRNGTSVKLTSSEYMIAESLLASENKHKSRMDLISVFNNQTITARTIDVHVHAMRKKLEKIGVTFEAIRGYGYKIIY